MLGDKVLLGNSTRDIRVQKYNLAYCLVNVMGQQLELTDISGKTCNGNVQDVQHAKVTYPVDELVKYIPNENAFGLAMKYRSHPKLMEDLKWSFNTEI